MRLLDRYLLRELLIPFGYCLGGFFIFWVTFDLFNELSEFQRKDLTFLDGVEYYLVKTPELLVFVVPVALLLAMLYALSNHARHQELVAMRAAGVSLIRISFPYLLVGGIMSVGLFALNELWVPQSARAAERILTRHEDPETRARSRNLARKVWLTRGDRKLVIEAYNTVTEEMFNPHLSWVSEDGFRHDVTAEAAAYRDGAWTFTNAQEWVFPPTAGASPTKRDIASWKMDYLPETPAQINGQIKINRMKDLKTASNTHLSIREILDYRKWNPEKTGKTAMLNTKLHGRIADPWKCLIIVLIALPFGAATSRRNVYAGVASSILIGFVYFVVLQLALAFGSGGYIPAPVAAWAPNFLFAATGLFICHRVQ